MKTSNRTLVCSVLFLDIVEYSKNDVNEQIRQKRMFNDVLFASMTRIRPEDRIVVDTGDGAAVAFGGDPEDALFVALAFLDQLGSLPVRMGINLGPVHLVNDLNGHANVIGDGINVAQRVMSFANSGQLLVSRSFYEVVSRLSEDYASLFRDEGERRDKHIRAHEIYAVVEGVKVARRLANIQSRPKTDQAATGDARAPAVPRSIDESPAQVSDAGSNLIISGSKLAVEAEVKKLVQKGARIVSAPVQVGQKWMAACENLVSPKNECKIETILGSSRMITSENRAAVEAKVKELRNQGFTLIGEIALVEGSWMAVCDIESPR